ncbi:MAG: Nif3-like dinuclear metal center hexameric protein [Fusobacteriota bacterium]
MGKVIVNDIIKKLEKKFPRYLKEDWDNVGLLVGENNLEIKKMQISLDLNKKVIQNAIDKKIDMIITHHPFIFKGIKTVTNQTRIGKNIIKLIKNNIAVYTLHTNLDSAKDGLNDYIVEKLGVKESESLIQNEVDENSLYGGIGRIYNLETGMKITEYAKKIKKNLKIKNIRVIMDEDKKIKKIGLINGSGMSYVNNMKKAGVDLFITGDIKYHEAFDSLEAGLPLIDIGHYESEVFFSEIIKREISEDEDIEIFIYNDSPVFEII